jgi:protein-disulfide isomerase
MNYLRYARHRMARQLMMLLWIGLQSSCLLLPDVVAQSVTSENRPAYDAAKTNDSASSGAAQRQQLDEILKELHEIRTLLQKTQLANPTLDQMPAAKIELSVDSSWHVMGKADAPIAVVEFTDLQCPFCHQFERATFPSLKANYIDRGQVKFISVDLPLSMHSYAEQAAEAVQCAGDQGKFWDLRSALFQRQDPPTKSAVLESEKRLGLDIPQLQACLNTNKYKDQVASEAKSATDLDVHGTPTFVIGRLAGGKLTGVELNGALSYQRFQFEIDKLLQDQKSLHTASAVGR